MINTKHITQRQSQRSIPKAIVSYIYQYGESLNDNELYLSKKSALAIKAEIRSQLQGVCAEEAFFFGSLNNDRSITKKENASPTMSKLIEQIDRCVGVKLIASGEILITCYRCGKKQQKSASIKRREKFIH
jgi:hypothetical protein